MSALLCRAPRRGMLSVAALVAATCFAAGNAAAIDWVGGNDPWDGDIFNWNPNDEPDPNDPVVFNTDNHVEMAMDNEIASLTMSDGIELDTESYFLDVNGAITLSDAGTILRAGESDTIGLPPTSVSAYNITVNDGATYANANFTSIIDPAGIGLLNINTGGTLAGHGLIRSGDGIGTPTVVFSNDGVIRPGSVSDGFIIAGGNPTARTLTLASIDIDGRIDLDGVFGDGALDINRNQTLDIDLAVNDDFDGTIDLSHNATLDIESAWEFAGTMNVATGFVAGTPPFIPSVPADVAYLAGGQITMNESTTTINVLDDDGTLQFDAEFIAVEGTIANNGHIIFNQDATIGANVDFQMIGVEADMTVGAGATVVINDADMDFDGGGASTNVITVEADGLLDLNLDSFEGNDRADGFLTLNSGSLSLTVADGSWTMERRLTLNNTGGGVPVVSGSAMVVGDDAILTSSNDADIRVEGNGVSQIAANVTFNSDAEVDVAAGTTLAITGFSTFNSVNGNESALFDGQGDIYFSGGQVNEATTLNFSGGTVGLDGGGGGPVILLGAPDFTIDAWLTINAAAIDSYGRQVAFPSVQSSELTVNSVGGRLTVNLDDPNDSWEINDVGIMHANSSDLLFHTFLAGNRLEMNGTLNVDGRNVSQAPLTIGGTVNIVDGLANLRLNAGSPADPNRLEGGAINGPGELSSVDNVALYGHGTIGASIDMDGGNSELLADDGTLTLSGAIQDVGTLGTADSDGVLNVTNVWSTSDTDVVRLNGGELTGATINNFGPGGIRGAGLVSARVQNDTLIGADSGGMLVVDTPLNNNDWDGPANAGTLQATGGATLELHDNAAFLFNGTVAANNGTVRAVGFELEFDPGSTLELSDGGVYRSTQATDIGGTVTVGGGAASRLQVGGTVVLESSSATTLAGDLIVDNPVTRVEAGATFAGGGRIVNPAGRLLQLEDGADVDVLVQNRGTLALGNSPGQTTGADFEQTAAGLLEIELAGTGLADYDRMSLTGVADLDGELAVSLLGGFAPALGDVFTLVTAASVLGQFASEDFSSASLDPGLAWDVLYNPTSVQLAVIEELFLAGDYNEDGTVDAADYTVWRDNLGQAIVLPNEDATPGMVTQEDYDVWKANFGAVLGAGSGSLASVPEPGTLGLVLLLLGFSTCRGRAR